MKRNNRTGSQLFFIEFIIVLFFFLIVSTVCLRLFARAHGITQRADALSHAQAAAASVAAVVEDVLSENANDPGMSGKDILESVAGYLPGASLSALPDDPSASEGLVIFYDKEFQTCAADNARYLLTAALEPADGQNGSDHTAGQNETGETLTVSVTDYDHTPVYELSAAFHRPMTREEALQ